MCILDYLNNDHFVFHFHLNSYVHLGSIPSHFQSILLSWRLKKIRLAETERSAEDSFGQILADHTGVDNIF